MAKLHPAEQYIKDVLSGKILACEYVKLACRRHVNDLEKGHKRGLVFDPYEAQRWIDFAHLFHAHKNKRFAGKKITLSPHQQFEFWVQMGWKRKDGTRRFRTSYVEVARKDGKTTREAIKANGHLFLDGEQGAQIWFAATKKDQALIALNDAAKVAKATPVIDKYYEYTKRKDQILRVVMPSTGSFMAAIGRDQDTEDGHDPSWGVIDEMHEHPTLDALHILNSGAGSRAQPMFNIITTAGFDQQKPCYSTIRKSVIEILQGITEDDAYFGVIYTLDDPEKEWEKPEMWVKANPNLGVTVTEDFLLDEYRKARNEGAATEVNFKTKHLNIWTDAAAIWIPDRKWMQCAGEPVVTAGKKWYGGLDLASTQAFCAFALFSEPDSDGVHDVLCWSWIPEEGLRERERKDKKNYRDWIRDGFLFTTPGDATDYDYIENFVVQKYSEFNITGSGYDRWNAQMLINRFNARSMNFYEFSQSMAAQTEPTKMLERLILQGKIRHGGHPVLRWNNGNVTARMDANGNIILDKSKSGYIDGIRALVNAIGMWVNRDKIEAKVSGFYVIPDSNPDWD